jgi:hypothetical protein
MSEPSKQELPAIAALMLCVILIFGPVVIADHVDLPELKVIGYSVFVGVLMAYLGYAKSQPMEAFDAEKFIITPITGVFAGIAIAFFGYSYAEALTWLANIGVLALVEFAGKAIVRRFWATQPG